MPLTEELPATAVDWLEGNTDLTGRPRYRVHHEIPHQGAAGVTAAKRRVRIEGNVDAVAAFAESFAQVVGYSTELLAIHVAGE